MSKTFLEKSHLSRLPIIRVFFFAAAAAAVVRETLLIYIHTYDESGVEWSE